VGWLTARSATKKKPHSFVNPVAIGRGMRIFTDRKPLRFVSSTAYSSGVIVNDYQPVS
jgi:hypothetical protein